MIGQILTAICKVFLALCWLEIIFQHFRPVSVRREDQFPYQTKMSLNSATQTVRVRGDIFRRFICDSPWTYIRDFAFHNKVTLHGNGIQAIESNDVM